MNRFTAISLFVLALVLAALAAPTFAEACSCAGPGKEGVAEFYARSIRGSDGAVVVKVEKVRVIDADGSTFGDEELAFTLRVRRAFKLFRQFPSGRRFRIRTSAQSSACGLDLEPGDRAGLLLFRYRGRLSSSSCGQAKPHALRRGYERLHDEMRRDVRPRAAKPAADCLRSGADAVGA